MAYVAAVQAYGADPEDVAESGGVPAPDPVAPPFVQIFGFASETTRNWLSGLEVSPRSASTPEAKIHGVPCLTQTITITDASGTHELVFTAGLLTEYTLTPP